MDRDEDAEMQAALEHELEEIRAVKLPSDLRVSLNHINRLELHLKKKFDRI